MNDNKANITELLRKFQEKTASPQEIDMLFALFKDEGTDETIREYLLNVLSQFDPSTEDVEYWKSRLWENKLPEKLRQSIRPAEQHIIPAPPRFAIKKWLYAATIVLVAGAITYFIADQIPVRTDLADNDVKSTSIPLPDKAPGRNLAVLTLSDGSSIVLDSSSTGIIASEHGASVQKTAEGSLLYRSNKKSGNDRILYNTMSTPGGGQYQLTLSDGTKVWLNALSSITFPAVFSVNERSVSITGEVYLEVAHNSEAPFKVRIGDDTEIRVLGTSFNINAYSDEQMIRTTLLEGSLDVKAGNKTVRLKPGNQARSHGSDLQFIDKVNTRQTVAWKDGAFSFERDNLDVVLRQISRWYDVKVVYETTVPHRTFSGKMGRNLNLSQILVFLKEMNLNIKFDGNKIIVME